jgi:hypothetical protein
VMGSARLVTDMVSLAVSAKPLLHDGDRAVQSLSDFV